MSQPTSNEPPRLSAIHAAVRDEVDCLAKARLGVLGGTQYPDPAMLDPMDRRLLVRSVFSAIEADVFALKHAALREDRKNRLSAGEIAMAREVSHEVTEAGAVRGRSARIRSLSNLRLAFALWAKVHAMDDDLDVHCTGWADLKAALKVRDRLTHPKGLRDLNVTDDEVRQALSGFVWFDLQLNYALDDAVCSLIGGKRLRLTSAST